MRYGVLTHCVFLFFALLTNILVGSQLLLGGSAVVTSLTGMNVYAAIWLIPTGVCIYVVLGGLRATFLCAYGLFELDLRSADVCVGDYSHTLILMIVILYFMFTAYVTNNDIGSPSQMHQLLMQAGAQRPVAGNQNGSYLTLKSNFALVFGIIGFCSGSGTMFLDQAYWQRAIASRPSTAVRAYILGGFAWFAVPFGFATTLGLAAVALTDSASFPTFPSGMSQSQVTAGLASPFAASALLGKGGAVAMLVVLFMAVTSCASAELIAVSSILTFDIYQTYIRPTATPSKLVTISHVMVCVFGLTMAAFASIWNVIGVDLGWLFMVMGLLIGGAVFPVAFAICWKGQTRAGAIAGSVTGLCTGLLAWLVTAKRLYGTLTVATTGLEYPTLAGNLAAILTGLSISVVVSKVEPQRFDWEITRSINSQARTASSTAIRDDRYSNHRTILPNGQDDEKHAQEGLMETEDQAGLDHAYKVACVATITLIFIIVFLVPIPMFLSHYIFSEGFFTAWVIITFIWVFASSGISCILPIWETRTFLKELCFNIFGATQRSGC